MNLNEIKCVVIAGAGIMGASMAQSFAEYGYSVIIYDLSDQALERAKEMIAVAQYSLVQSGSLRKETSESILANISFMTDKACFTDCDIVVESIIENLGIKKQFYSEISQLVRSNTILATNTSALPISEIAQSVEYPERFVGMHWFNPPHIIPLIEVIRGNQTSEEIADIVYELALQINKKPVHVLKDAKGFVANRLQFALLREALHILDDGIASKEDIDQVVKFALGFRYAAFGVFEIADFGGLDTFKSISEFLNPDLCDRHTVSETLVRLVSEGSYGVKSERGFYDYSNGKDKEMLQKRDIEFIKLYECLFLN